MSDYEATMPDGSVMVIEVLNNDHGMWVGEFVVSAETGPHAFEVGSFEGKVSGNNLTAVCEPVNGEEFQLEGVAHGSESMQLTRSDMPGVTLDFHVVAGRSPGRADVSFLLTTGGTNNRVIINSTPYAYHGTTITEYRGSWNGLPTTFWAYSSGTANVVIYVDPLVIETVVFGNYPISAFSTATVAASTAQTTVYSNTIKAQVKFKGSATASP